MEKYQERLLEIAGWKPSEDGIGWDNRKPVGTVDYSWTDGIYGGNFHSLDWLETYIMPSLRKEKLIWKELYYFTPIQSDFECHLIHGNERCTSGVGNSKVSALLAALKELIKE